MSQYQPIPPRASLPAEERRTTQGYTLPRQTRAHNTADVHNDDEEPQRSGMPRSARRYSVQDQHPERQLIPAQSQPGRQRHPMLYIGLGMLSTLTLVILVFGPLGSWWTDWRNYTTYGDPRTFQTDAIVDQNDGPGHQSHFLALNLHGQIMVIEFPGSDPSRGRDFLITTLTGPNADRVPVTLSFADLTGDGKLDMLIQFNGQQVVYINDSGTFRPAKPGEVLKING